MNFRCLLFRSGIDLGPARWHWVCIEYRPDPTFAKDMENVMQIDKIPIFSMAAAKPAVVLRSGVDEGNPKSTELQKYRLFHGSKTLVKRRRFPNLLGRLRAAAAAKPVPIGLMGLVLLSAVWALACDEVDPPVVTDEYTREEARHVHGTTEENEDVCLLMNWYLDGTCDPFCIRPDPDCSEIEDPCEQLGYYSDGICDDFCPEPDPDCGTLCGSEHGSCADGEFCDFPDDDPCGGAGRPGSCEPRPEACTGEAVPVCGCDSVTYSNDCSARASGVDVLHGGTCESPPECCSGDEDCTEGGERGVCIAGVCKWPTGVLQSCWSDIECPQGTCEGATICPCGFDCFEPDSPGECRGLEPGCCSRDSDCRDGMICAGQQPDGNHGACAPAPGPEECYTDADCGEWTCEGGSACGCMMNCPSQLGICARIPDPFCCFGEHDCPGGLVCATMDPSFELPGTCMEPAGRGRCWSDIECGEGGRCDGVVVCPCGRECGQMESPGICVQDIPPCCSGDVECGPSHMCVGQDPDGFNGSCVPYPAANECYDDSHCEDGMCIDGMACGCNVDCLSTLGRCLDAGCCMSDRECANGQVCAGRNDLWNLLGVCLEPAAGQECWADAECADGLTCEGEEVCPCGAECFEPDSPGSCMPDLCCWTDDECDRGMRCVGQEPHAMGQCVPAADGNRCWDQADCGRGTLCVGSYACPCLSNCGEPHSGYCEAIGVCCLVDAHCSDGILRGVCVGAGNGEVGVCQQPTSEGCWRDEDCADGFYCEDAHQFLRKAFAILNDYEDAFCSDDVEALVPTLRPTVYANRFSGDANTAWTLFNAEYRTFRGDCLRVPHKAGTRYLDAFTERELAVMIEDGVATIPVELGPRAVGCVVAVGG